jgi:hypothetical protein
MLVVSGVGWLLPSFHGGRQYLSPNGHTVFAKWVICFLLLQAAIGGSLYLQLRRLAAARVQTYLKQLYTVLGVLVPVLGWTQMIIGGEVSSVFSTRWQCSEPKLTCSTDKDSVTESICQCVLHIHKGINSDCSRHHRHHWVD